MSGNILQNYPGSKTNTGILQWLINNMPYHEHYYELFAGTAALYYNKRPATHSTLMDMDNNVIQAHKAKAQPGTRYMTDNATVFIQSVKAMLERDCFMYLDPPYPFDCRRNQRDMYKCEMTDSDHVQLLDAIQTMDANIMISTRPNELYDIHLSGWRKEYFNTVNHQGAVQEIIYMNYPPPIVSAPVRQIRR